MESVYEKFIRYFNLTYPTRKNESYTEKQRRRDIFNKAYLAAQSSMLLNADEIAEYNKVAASSKGALFPQYEALSPEQQLEAAKQWRAGKQNNMLIPTLYYPDSQKNGGSLKYFYKCGGKVKKHEKGAKAKKCKNGTLLAKDANGRTITKKCDCK